ncbi:hypothetical protein Droror1_Dr00002647 [Drosera rotundifolia]
MDRRMINNIQSQHHHGQQHDQHQLLQQQQQHMVSLQDAGDGSRFPQWSNEETKEFLVIRAELDRSFMETKRNRVLWEVISTRMKEKGFSRSAEQCKCKWKNMVTRYKGCETMEPEAMRQQFPFYNELQAIFTARMQRMLWAEAEGVGGPSSGTKKRTSHLSSDEEDEDYDHESDRDRDKQISGTKRKKAKSTASTSTTKTSNIPLGDHPGSHDHNVINSLKEFLEEFMRQQLQIEMQWMAAWEAREEERWRKETEWRQTTEALENERLMMEREWRQREEERRVREETRAERRDALINALLEQLRRDNL